MDLKLVEGANSNIYVWPHIYIKNISNKKNPKGGGEVTANPPHKPIPGSRVQVDEYHNIIMKVNFKTNIIL